FFFSSRRRHTRFSRDWSSDVCSSDLASAGDPAAWGGPVTDSVDLPGEDSVALVSPHAAADEQDAEASVRPRRLAEFIAQHRVREQLQLLLTSALRRGAPPDHILLCGPPGLGKTTLAMIIEIGRAHV